MIDGLLQTIAPDLYALPNKQGAIDMAELQVGAKLCGDKRPMLVAYLAAHILSLSQRSLGAAGSVTSLSEGGLSVGFGSSGVMGSLSQTTYGQEYDRISKGCIFSPRTRITKV